MNRYIAFDLGASSGRAMLGTFENGEISLTEIHRFENGMVRALDHYYWDILSLYQNMKIGLKGCFQKGFNPASVGIDTWGVDFALLAENGEFCGNTYAYRDPHTTGMMEEVFKHITKRRIYELTGIQFLPFNTIYQLFTLVHHGSPHLKIAQKLLFVPDIFTYLFTGEKRTESTFASTSQLYNPITRNWEPEIFSALNLPMGIMPEIMEPGSMVRKLKSSLCQELHIPRIPMISVATHDTASAVASVPAEGDRWAYISSGTWSVMGVEVSKPVLTDKALQLNFSNEQGVSGTTRLLKNIMGLWMVQECRRIWASSKSYTFSELVELAEGAPAFKSIIYPDYPEFLNPPDMVKSIQAFCQKTGQAVPETPGEYIRAILEGLAFKYAQVAGELADVTGVVLNKVHIVGGGSQNRLLNQFTANATGMEVVAGPSEATATGNVLMQAVALGHISTVNEGRRIIARSSSLKVYQPQKTIEWAEAAKRYYGITQTIVTRFK